MSETDRPYTLDRIVRMTISLAVLVGFIWLLSYLSDVLIPFAVALLLAYLINPLVNLVKRKIRYHGLAVFISLALVFAAAFLVVIVTVPLVLSEVRHMGTVVSNLVDNGETSKRIGQYLPEDWWQQVQDFLSQEKVRALFKTEQFLSAAEAALKKILPGIWGIISGTGSLLAGLFGMAFIVLYLVFILMDYAKISAGWSDLINPRYREALLEFLTDFQQGMHRYFRGQALVAGLVGVIVAFGFWLIGLPLGILMGLLIGLLNMVPYLQLIAVPPVLILAAVHAVETGNSVLGGMALAGGVILIAQVIQDGFLVPRIMGNVTGMSPAVILLSLSIWGKLLGMLGLIIALPMTALLVAYYKRFLALEQKRMEVAVTEEGSGGP